MSRMQSTHAVAAELRTPVSLGRADHRDDDGDSDCSSFSDEDADWGATNPDASMQFVSVKALPGSAGFKPTIPYNMTGRVRIPRFLSLPDAVFGGQRIAGFEELHAFALSVSSGKFDFFRTLRMFTNRSPYEDKAGSAVPLTPSAPGDEVVAVTADHCVRKQKDPTLTPEILAPWHSVVEDRRVPVEVLESRLPAAVEAAGEKLRKPSSPEKNLPRSWRRADIAYVLARPFSVTSGYEMLRFLVPCADLLATGMPFGLLGHAGYIDGDYVGRWVCHEGDMLVNGELDYKVAHGRLQDLLMTAVYMGNLAVSPGQIHAANDEVVEHTASVVPGYSGGGGVDLDKPHLLYFHHLQSQRSVSRKWSYGVSVRHDVYGYQYLTHVLPRLENAPRTEFYNNVLPDVVRYIKHWREKWEAWSVTATVESFFHANGIDVHG